MNHSVPPLSIEVIPRSGGRYKSITALSWHDIPPLAVLTGKNGSGKTQLLELFGYHFSKVHPHGVPASPPPLEIQVSGYIYEPEEIAFVPSTGRFSGGGAMSLATMQQTRHHQINAHQQLSRSHKIDDDIAAVVRAKRISKRLGNPRRNLTPSQKEEAVFEGSGFLSDDIDITVALSHLFVSHRAKLLEASERGEPDTDEKGKKLKPEPWVVLNDALQVAGFPYAVISPERTRLTDSYELLLRDLSSNLIIKAADLSSGEKVIFQLVLWLYTANVDGNFPKLLLLDEPDAHLHPSMTTQFLDVILEVLVKRHGVRVIMTTHSPSTVALSPDGAVFQLERGASIVKKVGSRAEIISILTAGLVTVSLSTKFCFVEDEIDVGFYEAIASILMDEGPSRDPKALKPSPTIAFIAASVGKGPQKVSGGSSNVAKWVQKLDADPLERTFFGIIDRDVQNVGSTRVHVIGRYSFENYLLDPLNIFCLLLEAGTAPAVAGVTISSGDEHRLRQQPAHVLQAISGVVTRQMEQIHPQLAKPGTKPVSYTIDAQIDVPSWVIDYRGHDLLSMAQKVFGGPNVVSPHRLIKAMRRCRLIPVELATLLSTIQSA